MRHFVELSGTLQKRLWGYYSLPGLEGIIPNVEIETLATVEQDGFFASKVSFSTISGTYVEAGSHILPHGRLLDSYSLPDFIKPCTIIRLPRQKPHSVIRRELLEKYAVQIKPGEALVIDTGWGAMWNEEGYVLTCPTYANDAIAWILEQKPGIFGVDVPCIEASWSEDNEQEKGGLLGELFENESLLVAPLINLNKVIASTGTLYCIPVPVEGTSGAPARVFIETEK